jgi:UDP-GlcNAc3NAcA epimerase
MPQLLTILGARPQFIKAAALTRAIRERTDLGWKQNILHTGQHYDEALSQIFFSTLDLPVPRWKLHIEHSSRNERMEEMRSGIKAAILSDRPDAILVYGDTDSTLAGAQVAHQLKIPLIHVEAGLRSFDLDMPEEVNRIETDKLADILIAPTKTAVSNLEAEGIFGAFLTGDVMHDNALHFTSGSESERADKVLLTMHRPSNVDDASRVGAWLKSIGSWCAENALRAVFPVHPRTLKAIESLYGETWREELAGMCIDAVEPVGYIELLGLIKSSKLVVTDSGGIQEAYSCATPSVVIRHNTEWVELVEAGHAVLCPEPEGFSTLASAQLCKSVDTSSKLYGDGKAAESILEMITEKLRGADIVISTNNPTARMKYAADVLFRVCLGLEVVWDESFESERSHSYTISSGGNIITCPIHAISFAKDEVAVSAGVKWVEYEGCKYPCEVLGLTDLQFDPLAAVLFYVARWEEVFCSDDELKKDIHGRFMGVHSAAHIEGVLERPVVEVLALQLAAMLGLKSKSHNYVFKPTIDVDIPYAYSGRSVLHNAGATLRDALLMRWPTLIERLKVVFGNAPDPYDTFEQIYELHKSHGLKSTAFILFARFQRPYDLTFNQSDVSRLIERLETGWDVNWHPSYAAVSDFKKRFAEEKKEFSLEVKAVRTHFLRGNTEVWGELVKNCISEDYSMGYADLPGFRAGISRAYSAFSLTENKVLPLEIQPVAVMDSTLHTYMGLSPEEAAERVGDISNSVKEVGGTMVTLWHNVSVSDRGVWKGWQGVYEEVVRRCIP